MADSASVGLPASGRLGLLGERGLATRARRGDRTAFVAIYDRYHQELYRYCLSIVRDPHDAQDALQSTMASALKSLPGEEREIALRPWLYRVARNHAISIVRGRGRHDGEQGLAALPDPCADERPEQRERLRLLLGDLDQLPERQRDALTMREMGGVPFAEIGAALGMSAAAARQAVYEARVGLSEFEEGRAMECARAQELISAGDRRSLRALRMRAHLRACPDCRAFRGAIERRRADLGVLFPVLSPVAATAVLKALLGGSATVGAAGAGAAAGVGATVAGPGLGASLAVKSASVLAIGALGVGAADYSGLVDVPALGGGERGEQAAAPAAKPASSTGSAGAGADVPSAGGGADAGAAGASAGGSSGARGDDRPGDGGNGNHGGGPAQPNAGGQSTPAPSTPSNAGETPAADVPQGPPSHSNAGGNPTPGVAQGPPAHSNAGGNPAPGTAQGPPVHSNAGGNSGSGAPPAHSNAGGASATAPGHAPEADAGLAPAPGTGKPLK